jgi:hypothetical protein
MAAIGEGGLSLVSKPGLVANSFELCVSAK